METETTKSEAFTNIESRWLDNPHLSDLNPLSVGWHARGKGGSFGPAVRDVYIMQYVISGKGTYTVKDVTYHLGKGDLFLIRPNEVIFYQADEENPYTYIFMDFNGTKVSQLLKYVGFSSDTYVQHVPEAGDVFQFFRSNTSSGFAHDIEFTVKLYELFAVLYAKNKTEQTKASLPESHARKVVNYIHTNYMQDIRISTIADSMGLDRRYLSRIFKEYLGVTLQDYLINYRMEKARLLLQSQSISVSEVCHSVGYDDVFGFSKMYKKRYGIPPSQEGNR